MKTLSKIILSVLLITLIVTAQSTAGTLTYEFDYMFTGQTPEGPMPWITAVFDDSYGDSKTVRLNMTANNLTGNQFVSEWYFNFAPTLNPNLLSFDYVDSLGVDVSKIKIDTGRLKADGDGYYDIKFDLPQANNTTNEYSSRFDQSDSLTYDITYFDEDIDVLSFDYLSDPGGGAGTYVSAAQISANSTWVAPASVVPEPISSILFIVGGATIGAICIRNKRKRQV